MDVSDIFYFFCSGEGKGESGATGRGGCRFLLKIPGKGGGGLPGGGGEGAGRVSAGHLGGRGLNIFFGGPKCPPRESRTLQVENPENPGEERHININFWSG